MRNLILLTLLISSSLILAQDQQVGTAVLTDIAKVQQSPYAEVLYTTLVNRMNVSSRMNYQFYNWKESEDELNFDADLSTSGKVACDMMIFLQPSVVVTERPELQYKQDTTGKTTDVFFKVAYNSNIQYKVINVSTSEVEDIGSMPFNTSKTIDVPDYKKYFKSDPAQMKESGVSAYAKIEKQIQDKYLVEFRKYFDKATREAANNLSGIANGMKSVRDDRIFKITDYDKNILKSKGKIKSLKIDAGTADDIVKGDRLSILSKNKYGDFEVVEELMKINVSESSVNSSTCDVYGKKLGSALLSGKELYVGRNKKLIYGLASKAGVSATATVDKECMFCAFRSEMTIGKITGIRLIERSHTTPLRYFIYLAKSDKFLDLDLDAVLSNQKGVRYIIEMGSEEVKATDVETGNVYTESLNIKRDNKVSRFFKATFTGNKGMLKRLFLDLFDKDVELVEVSDQKKDKIKKVIAFHPIGFEKGAYLKVFEVSVENVGGKSIERESEIGRAYATDIKSGNIAELSIGKGKKEIFKAMEKGKKIKFIDE